MRRGFLPAFCIAAMALVLTATPAAWSAVAYQIRTEPQRPVVGQEALISVSTTVFGTGEEGASPEPFPTAEFPWEFVADAPSGARHTIALTPTGTSQSEWRAKYTFDEVGDWEVGLHPRHFGSPPDPALGARSTVTVVGSASGRQDVDLALLTVVAAIAVAAALGLTIQRRRSVTSHDIPQH